MIPFFELKRQYQNIKEELEAAQKEVFEKGNFISGNQVSKFERDFAEYLGVKYCVTCGNGTDALGIVLKLWGIGPGDEVIVPAFTWFSDAEAVSEVGAKIVFVDIEENYFGIDPGKLGEKITKKTKAVIAVHLFGHLCLIEEIKKITQDHDLLLLEDAAQAHGASKKGVKAGNFGDAAIFSFYPTKNLGAYGDGGAVVSNDPVFASIAKLYINHGQEERNEHTIRGRNSRLDELQAAYLNVKLKHLDSWNQLRKEHAAYYLKNLNKKYNLPKTLDDHDNVFHQFVIRAEHREQLIKHLTNNDVGYALHYPYIIPSMAPYFEQGNADDYPVAFRVAGSILSLPVFPELKNEEIERVVDVLNNIS